ncbi:hypothetical protein GL270_07815 [Aeromonas veronii]|uniref:Uncharacterized protein n=1 Tax=Aeromonas veronii TaxID=654 RepID=A0A4V3Z0R6_AERVE|nr:hypothetical protein CVS42_06465 [Aeromonas veronii]MBA2080416.1 hypothetical protein [Aeromonas veronii]MBW3781154.1 hypothetical protein [Aeromonas veronii]THJ47992.1 hypothetical protein E8Q35_02335 [Aeromonas veronii]TNH70977.1 hypothetical protein CF105_12855 [Aeromonas veronii]
MQNWYQRARKIQEGTEEFDFSKSRFHKDIYLSGMFMYVLAPNLCKAIANALGPEQVSMTTLRHAFASCGFNLGEVAGEAQPAADVMIDEIVARLAPQLGQSDTTSLVDEIVSRLGEQQPAEMWDELRQGLPAALDHDQLAEAIAGKLPSAGAEQDLAPLASSIQLLSRQLEEQSRLIREQHRLIQRLASAPARQSVVGTEAEPLIEDLSSQVANMKKVKAKGIF